MMNSNNIIINGILISNDHVFYISNILILRNYIITDHDNNFIIFHIDSRAAWRSVRVLMTRVLLVQVLHQELVIVRLLISKKQRMISMEDKNIKLRFKILNNNYDDNMERNKI